MTLLRICNPNLGLYKAFPSNSYHASIPIDHSTHDNLCILKSIKLYTTHKTYMPNMSHLIQYYGTFYSKLKIHTNPLNHKFKTNITHQIWPSLIKIKLLQRPIKLKLFYMKKKFVGFYLCLLSSHNVTLISITLHNNLFSNLLIGWYFIQMISTYSLY